MKLLRTLLGGDSIFLLLLVNHLSAKWSDHQKYENRAVSIDFDEETFILGGLFGAPPPKKDVTMELFCRRRWSPIITQIQFLSFIECRYCFGISKMP